MSAPSALPAICASRASSAGSTIEGSVAPVEERVDRGIARAGLQPGQCLETLPSRAGAEAECRGHPKVGSGKTEAGARPVHRG